MGDLSVALNNSGIGGYLGDAFLNHLCYADDICLIACLQYYYWWLQFYATCDYLQIYL